MLLINLELIILKNMYNVYCTTMCLVAAFVHKAIYIELYNSIEPTRNYFDLHILISFIIQSVHVFAIFEHNYWKKNSLFQQWLQTVMATMKHWTNCNYNFFFLNKNRPLFAVEVCIKTVDLDHKIDSLDHWIMYGSTI